jgi:hypothetical protein
VTAITEKPNGKQKCKSLQQGLNTWRFLPLLLACLATSNQKELHEDGGEQEDVPRVTKPECFVADQPLSQHQVLAEDQIPFTTSRFQSIIFLLEAYCCLRLSVKSNKEATKFGAK